MQSSETWTIQLVPVHVSSSIRPRHHFFRLLGPWGEKYSVVGSVASVASVAVSHGSHANYEPWLPFEEPGQSNTEGWKGLNGIIRNLTRISSNIFCVWQNWRNWYLYLLYFRICHNTRKWDLCRSTSPRCSRLQLGGASRRNGIFALPVVATLHIN